MGDLLPVTVDVTNVLNDAIFQLGAVVSVALGIFVAFLLIKKAMRLISVGMGDSSSTEVSTMGEGRVFDDCGNVVFKGWIDINSGSFFPCKGWSISFEEGGFFYGDGDKWEQ